MQQHAGLFGQLTWKASDKIELQFGARQSWDHNSDEQHIFVALNTQIVGGPPTNCPDPKFTAVLPAQGIYNCFPVSPGNVVPYNDSTPTYKVGVNWTPTGNQFIYAFFARGYKSGGINNGLAFDPENVDDVEIGWKTSILDKHLQIQVGAFDMDYKNMQQPAFIVRPFGTGLSAAGAIQNIGSSTVKGVEASLNGAFGEFSFQFSVGKVDSDLGGITTIDPRLLARNLFIGNNNYVPGCNAGQVPIVTGGVPNCFDYSTSSARRSLSGAANLYSPNLSYNFSLSYGFTLGNGAKLRPRASFAHVDESFASLFQTDNYFKIDERNLRNLSVDLRSRDLGPAGLLQQLFGPALHRRGGRRHRQPRHLRRSGVHRAPLPQAVLTAGDPGAQRSPPLPPPLPMTRGCAAPGPVRRSVLCAASPRSPGGGKLPAISPGGGLDMVDGHVFRVEETHGRVLRAGNEIISQSTDVGWRSLYAAKFREAPLSVVRTGDRSSVTDLPPRTADRRQP